MTLGRPDLATRPVAIDREDVSGVEVTMTDRPSPLDGRIVDAAGNAVRDATVVVFPVDRASWPTAHDHLAGFARTRSLDGTYRFRHLVPGDYFIAAVDERRMGNWPRARFLEAIAKPASPVRIAPGQSRALQLTLQTR
jgi:protocatechuate 3,4-dioxygenase beta subunit